jgi:hypothetical protein
MLCLGKGNVPQMERFSNDASLDLDVDLLRRLRRWLRGACVAVAKAQAQAPTLRSLWSLHIPAGHTACILNMQPKGDRIANAVLCMEAGMTEVTISG